MKKKMIPGLLAIAMVLSGCGRGEEGKREVGGRGLYTTVVTYTGEDDDTKYLEIAGRSQKLVTLLEDKVGAFVMDAYNYQPLDDEGTPLYTANTHSYPEEIAPTGHTVRVSPNYFLHNPIDTADGSDLREQLVYDDRTLNLLVPERYRELEDEILKAYRDRFYFEKVTAEDDYNALANHSERVEFAEESLSVHIIYVKDGQQYFTYRSDCALDTDGWVTDPVVQIYTGNIHCNYAHSFLSQWLYIPFEGTAEEAYEAIRPYIEECGAEESVKRVKPVNCMPEKE